MVAVLGLRHTVSKGHDEWPSHVEETINCNGLAPAIVQHHCTAQKCAEEGTNLGRTHDPFFLQLT